MLRFQSRVRAILLTAFFVSGAVVFTGCTSPKDEAAPDDSSTDGSGARQGPSKPVSEMDIKTGFSRPKLEGREVHLAEGKNLQIEAWMAAEEKVTPTIVLDGLELVVKTVDRPKLKDAHPGYAYYMGYRCTAPSIDFDSGSRHRLEFVVDGIVLRTKTFIVIRG